MVPACRSACKRCSLRLLVGEEGPGIVGRIPEGQAPTLPRQAVICNAPVKVGKVVLAPGHRRFAEPGQLGLGPLQRLKRRLKLRLPSAAATWFVRPRRRRGDGGAVGRGKRRLRRRMVLAAADR